MSTPEDKDMSATIKATQVEDDLIESDNEAKAKKSAKNVQAAFALTAKYPDIPIGVAASAQQYVRNKQFILVKFINPRNELDALNDVWNRFENVPEDTKVRLAKSMITLIKNTLSAKRCEVIKKLVALLRSKCKIRHNELQSNQLFSYICAGMHDKGTMFPKDHLDLFYTDSKELKKTEGLWEKVINSYYIFIRCFCTKVSSLFYKTLKEHIFTPQSGSIKDSLSVSDGGSSKHATTMNSIIWKA
jgi:hypothetical protein